MGAELWFVFHASSQGPPRDRAPAAHSGHLPVRARYWLPSFLGSLSLSSNESPARQAAFPEIFCHGVCFLGAPGADTSVSELVFPHSHGEWMLVHVCVHVLSHLCVLLHDGGHTHMYNFCAQWGDHVYCGWGSSSGVGVDATHTR